MGGCSILVLMPILMGIGFALAFLHVAVWIYVAWAIISLIVLAIAYRLLASRGVFERYLAMEGWQRPAAVVGRWALRLAMLFLALSAAAAVGIWFFMHQG